jgi:hypothetical protein
MSFMSSKSFATRTDAWSYRDCFTIDPTKGAEAWAKLSQNELGLEVGMLPKTLHEALIETLRDRRSRKLLNR